jgi:L-ascorbate metabolism protein UlaG (beta-lactamase superfamily)
LGPGKCVGTLHFGMTLPRTDHFNGKTFFNPTPDRIRGLPDILRWRLTSRAQPWPPQAPIVPRLPPPPPAREGITVSWIGHSTFLVQTPQGNVLTDPVFSPRIGPVSWVGPRRAIAPGIAFAALPKIDAVLLSHDHYDHCDLPSLRALARRDAPVVVSPLNYAALLRGAGAAADLIELDWWQDRALPWGAGVRLVPARHWCRRSIRGANRRLWGGFLLNAGGRRLYHAGDSGFDPALFREIGRRAGPPDLALIPIGAYEPRWFMASTHMNPAEAVRVHLDLGAQTSVGMHWGTFQLTDEGREEPILALAAALGQAGVEPERFRTLEPGGNLAI